MSNEHIKQLKQRIKALEAAMWARWDLKKDALHLNKLKVDLSELKDDLELELEEAEKAAYVIDRELTEAEVEYSKTLAMEAAASILATALEKLIDLKIGVHMAIYDGQNTFLIDWYQDARDKIYLYDDSSLDSEYLDGPISDVKIAVEKLFEYLNGGNDER